MDRISEQIEEAGRRAALARGAGGGSRAQLVPNAKNLTSVQELPAGQALELDFDLLSSRCVFNGGQGQFAEVYRVLRTRVLQQMRQNDWSTLGVTSANPRAGKTTTSINLSLAIARDPSFSSVLLDCDFRRPNVHKSLMVDPEAGLIDYLQGNAELDEIMYCHGGQEWRFIPSGPRQHEAPSELFGSERMGELLDKLRAERESTIAVFDLPPATVGDDVLALSTELDAMLLIVEDEVTDERELRNALDLLKDNNIVGLVLNKAASAGEFVYSYYD